MTEKDRLANHLRAALDINTRIQSLCSRASEYAMNIHDEIEDLHARVTHLEIMHADKRHNHHHTPDAT